MNIPFITCIGPGAETSLSASLAASRTFIQTDVILIAIIIKALKQMTLSNPREIVSEC